MNHDNDEVTDAAMAFENHHYPHATPETRRLLHHARGTIVRFLDSDLGLTRPR